MGLRRSYFRCLSIKGRKRWVCDSELIELAKALGAPMVELFPARAQAVLRGQK